MKKGTFIVNFFDEDGTIASIAETYGVQAALIAQ